LHVHAFPHFSSAAVIQFILHHDIHESGFSYLATIKPALSYLEQAFDRASSFTPAVDLLLSGVKRRALQ
jgi:hypothetical protein